METERVRLCVALVVPAVWYNGLAGSATLASKMDPPRGIGGLMHLEIYFASGKIVGNSWFLTDNNYNMLIYQKQL